LERDSFDYLLLIVAAMAIVFLRYKSQFYGIMAFIDNLASIISQFFIIALLAFGVVLAVEHIRNRTSLPGQVYRMEFLKTPLKDEQVEFLEKIYSFLVEASKTGSVTGLHLKFERGFCRFYLLMSSRYLEKAFTTRLPEYDTGKIEVFKPVKRKYIYQIRGVPREANDPLKPLVEYFIASKASGDYIVLLKPKKPSVIEKILADWKYRSVSRSSQKQYYQEFLRKKTEQEIDYLSSKELERTRRLLDRLTSDRVFDAWIYVMGEDDTIAYKAALTIAGSLSSIDEKDASSGWHG